MEKESMQLNLSKNNLGVLETEIWDLLIESTKSYKDDFHLISMAYLNQNNEINNLTVVNRYVDYQKKQINFHTDYRSTKIKSLQQNKNTALLFYCRKRSLQIRTKCNATIEYDNEFTQNYWDATSANSRVCYMQPVQPGQVFNTEIYLNPHNKQFAENNMEVGKENFCVIANFVTELEVVKLSADGHWRCFFKYDAEGNCIDRYWLAP